MERFSMNSSALLNLKAEVLKKKEAFQKEKQQNNDSSIKVKSNRKNDKWIAENKGVQDRNNRDQHVAESSAVSWDKMKEIMAKKAELYDKLHSGDANEEELSGGQRENLLVDFNRKPAPVVEEEEFIEIIDELGRTRMVKKSEYVEVEQESATPVGPQFYDANKEIRSKAAGFFTFSLDENDRMEQQKQLADLRQETIEEQRITQAILEEREKRIQQRLELAKKRKVTHQLNKSNEDSCC